MNYQDKWLGCMLVLALIATTVGMFYLLKNKNAKTEREFDNYHLSRNAYWAGAAFAGCVVLVRYLL
jgi:hypothetical protein